MTSLLLHKIAPLVLFGGMSASAVHLIFLQALNAGSAEKLEAACIPGAPYSLPYIGIEAVDHGLCQAVTIFHAGLNSESTLPILHYFVAAIPVGSMLVAVEARRNGGRGIPWYIAYSTLFATLWQMASWGLIASLYSLLFVISGSAQRKTSKISQQDALSILVAFGVGAAMHLHFVYLANPYMTVLWQPFPLVMGLAQYISRNLFSSMAMSTASGHGTIIAAYALTFLASAPFHLALVLPNLSIANIVEWASSLEPVSAETGSLEEIMTLILKWDLPIGSSALLLTSLWFAKSFRQFFALAIAVIGGTAIVGPAATLSGILIWREAKFSRQS